MTTYIALFNPTDAGVKAAKDAPRRLDAAKKLLADMGGAKRVETLLARKLREVFGEGDPTGRGAEIAELYTEDCVVLLPLGRYVGRDALDRVAGELRAGHPDFVYAPHPPPTGCSERRA